MQPDSSWLSLSFTRTRVPRSMSCRRYFGSMNVTSGALFFAVGLGGMGCGEGAGPARSRLFRILIISGACGNPQTGPVYLDFHPAEPVLRWREVRRVIADQVLGPEVLQDLGKGVVQFLPHCWRENPAARSRCQGGQCVLAADVPSCVVRDRHDHDRI